MVTKEIEKVRVTVGKNLLEGQTLKNRLVRFLKESKFLINLTVEINIFKFFSLSNLSFSFKNKLIRLFTYRRKINGNFHS